MVYLKRRITNEDYENDWRIKAIQKANSNPELVKETSKAIKEFRKNEV